MIPHTSPTLLTSALLLLSVSVPTASGAPQAAPAVQVPASTELQLRFRQLLTSHSSRKGDPVIARVVRPVEVDGRIAIPLGSWVHGEVTGVRRVGLGFIRERAFIDIELDELQLPDGTTLPIDLRVTKIDDARERVDESGRIHGIRATASFASTISGLAISAGFVDPMLFSFTTAASLSTFRIPESEVIFPPGTEFRAVLESPVTVSATFPAPVPEYAPGGDERTALTQFIRDLPYRTATELTGALSDITNLLFIGTPEAVGAAFDAAGWGQTDTLGVHSSYLALRAIVENQGYREAPMSTLLLEGRRPVYTFAKTLNTFFERHHLRIFGDVGRFAGSPVLTSSSTHDSGIGFAIARKSFIHVIDELIDEERDKVVHDMVLTGCVDAVTYVERPWLPEDLSNSTGDTLRTDTQIAVMRMNDCASPQRVNVDLTSGLLDRPEASERPNRFARSMRNTVLALKDGLWRGNIIYQGYSMAKAGLGFLFRRAPPADGVRTMQLGGEDFLIVPGAAAHAQDVAPDDIHDLPARYEPVHEPRHYDPRLIFSFAGTMTGFGNDTFSTVRTEVDVNVDETTIRVPFALRNSIEADRGFVGRVTLRSGSHLSQEFSYTMNRMLFSTAIQIPDVPDIPIFGRMQMRQFGYNLLAHALPNGRRVRPYAAVGPTLQVIRLTDAVVDSGGRLNFAFKEVGLIKSTWDFGSKPPLEGGGIFQAGFQYGGGVKVHLTPALVFRADYRETISAQPDFYTASYPSLREAGLNPLGQTRGGPLRHRLFSVGFGIGF